MNIKLKMYNLYYYKNKNYYYYCTARFADRRYCVAATAITIITIAQILCLTAIIF